MDVGKLLSFAAKNSKLTGQLLVDVATHPQVEADLLKVKAGEMSVEQLAENNLPALEVALGVFAAAVSADPSVLGDVVNAVGGMGGQ